MVKGERATELSTHLVKEFESGSPPRGLIKEPQWPDKIKERIDAHIRARAERFGVDVNDKEAMKKARLENYRFYGAKVAIFVFCYSSLTE